MNLGIIFLLTMYLIFLQDLTIKFGSQQLYVCSFFIIISLLLLAFANIKYLKKAIFKIIKHTPVKYLLLYIIWIFVSAIFIDGMGTTLKVWLRSFLIWGLVVFPTLLFAMVIIPKYISYKKCLKVFLIMYQFIMYYGIFDFIARICKIYPIQIIHNFICSRSVLQAGRSFFEANSWERATSLFFEPSFFATFLFLFLPFSYVIATSYTSVSKNANISRFIKISLPTITWLNLLLTMSPMYITLSLVYTFVFFWKNILKIAIKLRSVVVIILLLISISLLFFTNDSTDINLNNKVVARIEKTIISFGDMDKLVENEGSLATRFLTSINTWQASKRYPIKGTGYGNAKEVMYNQYVSTNTPLTWEIQLRAIIEDGAGPASNLFFGLLLQTGWIGIILIYLFFLKTIYYSYKIKKYFIKQEAILLNSLYFICINYILLSFYWGYETYPIMWFIFGLLNSYILYYKTHIRKQLPFSRQNPKIEEVQ